MTFVLVICLMYIALNVIKWCRRKGGNKTELIAFLTRCLVTLINTGLMVATKFFHMLTTFLTLFITIIQQKVHYSIEVKKITSRQFVNIYIIVIVSYI